MPEQLGRLSHGNRDLIDLRSDTKTLPTEAMLEAMHTAELGDSKAGEDPTVKHLERIAAARVGKEAAMLVVSGTMANLVAHMTLADPTDTVILDRWAHVNYYEGGSAKIARLIPALLESDCGILDPDDIGRAIAAQRGWATPRLLHLENTHVMSGGRLVPLETQAAQCAVARQHGLAIHLDGARIFNAEIASGSPASEFTKHVDSVAFCLSKNLSCPVGAMLCGSQEFVGKAGYYRGLIGGGMRQAGVIAAAGIVALETMIDRLADDHRHARRLAQTLNEMPGLSVDLDKIDSSMVKVDTSGSDLSLAELNAAFAAQGLRVGSYPGNCLRFVTHRHHTDEIIDDVVTRIKAIFA